MSAILRRLGEVEKALRGFQREEQLRERQAGEYDWKATARPEQLAPEGDWTTWLLLGGRGSGKTRAAAEWLREQAAEPGRRLAIVAPTAADLRDICVEGVSGILAVCPPWERPEYEPTKRRLTWRNGTTALLVSSDEPDRLRGHNLDGAWCDELASWRRGRESWHNLMLCLRRGKRPRIVASTTPKPLRLLGELVTDRSGRVALSGMSTWDNSANLSPAFLSEIAEQYRGTSLEAQELDGIYLASLPGALWTPEMFRHGKPPETLKRVVVAVDPSASSEGDETGVVAVGSESLRRGWVLGDYSLRGSPAAWAGAVARACGDFGADAVIAEKNQGGEMVEHTLLSSGEKLPPIQLVHASKSKGQRAEPVALLYEQSRVFHSQEADLEELEGQLLMLCRDGYGGPGSPDRADAMIHGMASLIVTGIAHRPAMLTSAVHNLSRGALPDHDMGGAPHGSGVHVHKGSRFDIFG